MRILRYVNVFVAIALTTTALAAGYGSLRFGSLAATLDFARGEPILIDQRTKTVDGVSPGGEVNVTYYLTNNSGRPLNLVGVAPSCSCTSVQSMPMAFSPSETKAVTAKIKVAESATDSSGSMRLFTDEPGTPEITLNYLLRVNAPAAGRIHPGS